MADSDILQPLSKDDFPKLIEVLKQQWPNSIVAHNWICKQMKWELKVPNLKVHVFCPQGDWTRGTVVAFADGLAGEGRQYGVVYAPEGEEDKRLAEALLKTSVIPWRTMIQFSGVLERHIGAVKAAAEAARINLPPPQPMACLLYCAREAAAQLPLPKPKIPDARIGRLSKEHLDEVWESHTSFCDNMKPVIGTTLEHNHAYAVFVKQPDGSERIVSQCMEMEHGGLGMGHTHPDFQRNGFQVMLAAYVMKDMGLEGNSVSAFTWQDNIAVINGGKMVGLHIVGNVMRIDISPGK